MKIGVTQIILGDLSLADMIVSAVIMSAYAGLVFYALFLVVDAIVRIGMRTRSLRSLYMVRRHGDFVHQRIMTVFRLVLEIVWLLVALKLLHLLPIAWEFLKKVLWTKAQFGDVRTSGIDVKELSKLASFCTLTLDARYAIGDNFEDRDFIIELNGDISLRQAGVGVALTLVRHDIGLSAWQVDDGLRGARCTEAIVTVPVPIP